MLLRIMYTGTASVTATSGHHYYYTSPYTSYYTSVFAVDPDTKTVEFCFQGAGLSSG